MAFVSWATELQRAKDALANKTWDSYFVSACENRMEIRTTYTKLGNITSFIDWLEQKAMEESLAAADSEYQTGAIPFVIGGG